MGLPAGQIGINDKSYINCKMEIKFKRSNEIVKTITYWKSNHWKLLQSKASEIPKVTISNWIRIDLFIVGVCNETYIPLIEPLWELCNYHFYHFATSYSSIVLSNKRACHMIFTNSLFTTKKSRQSIILVSYCFKVWKFWQFWPQ